MPFFDRFTKRWANAGAIAEPSPTQADQGFSYLGASPPTVEQFNALFQMLDEKDNWLFGQTDQVLRAGGITPAQTPNTQLLSALRAMFGGDFGATPGVNGWYRISGSLIVQFGTGSTVTGDGDVVTFPVAFRSWNIPPAINDGSAAGWGTGFASSFGSGALSLTGFRLYARGWDASLGRFRPMPSLTYSWITLGY